MTEASAVREAPQGPPDRAAGWLHGLAVVVAVWTLVLLFAGGAVTSLRGGLSVPDWPTSFEHYVVNPPDWTTTPHVREEHGHRLLGWVLGLLVIGLAAWIQAKDPRRWMRRLGWTVLGAVCLQGVLGGLRVQWLQHWLAPVHGALGQGVFALVVAVAVFLSRDWLDAGAPAVLPGARKVRRAALLAAAAAYLQVVVGALVRHQLARADEDGRAVEDGGELFTILLPHIAWGVATTAFGLLAMAATLREAGGIASLRRPALLLGFGVVLQVLLGMGTYMADLEGNAEITRPPYQVWTATAHQAAGALVLAAAVVLLLRARRHLAERVPEGTGAALPAGGAA